MNVTKVNLETVCGITSKLPENLLPLLNQFLPPNKAFLIQFPQEMPLHPTQLMPT